MPGVQLTVYLHRLVYCIKVQGLETLLHELDPPATETGSGQVASANGDCLPDEPLYVSKDRLDVLLTTVDVVSARYISLSVPSS